MINNQERKELEFYDEVDDSLWDLVQLVARKMGMKHLTNDEFTNEDIMEVRSQIIDTLKDIKIDRKQNEVVYCHEDGTPYTEQDIWGDIYFFLVGNEDFDDTICTYGANLVIDVLYDYTMGILQWEHPSTILDQLAMEDEEIDIVKERVEKRWRDKNGTAN